MKPSPQGYRKVQHIHREGLAANRPLADDVLAGTLYFSTDTLALERSNGTAWTTYTGSGGGGGTPSAHHVSHEPGGSDEILPAAWITQSNTFDGDQTIDGDLFVTGTITPITQEQLDNINQLIGDPTGSRMLMSSNYASGLSLRHDDDLGIGRIACGNYEQQTYQPLITESESLHFKTGIAPVITEHVIVHPSGGVTVGEGVDHSTDPGVGVVKAREFIPTIQGPPGPAGIDGEDGTDGATGPQGIPGVDGADGATGPKGDKGDKGDTGPAGTAGLHASTHRLGGTDVLPNAAWTDNANVFTVRQTIFPSSGSPTAFYGLEIQGSSLTGGDHAGIILNCTNQAVDTRKWRLLVYQDAFRIETINDAETAVPTIPFIVNRAGNATIAGTLTLGGDITMRGGAHYISYNGTYTSYVAAGSMVLAVASYANVVHFINHLGPYIQSDGSTWQDFVTPNHMRLRPGWGNLYVVGNIVLGDGSGPALMPETRNLRIDVDGGFSFYWRGTGTQAFFSGQDGQVSSGHSLYRWASVWALNGVIQTSDASTKENIEDSTLGLEFIEKLRAKEFKYINDDVSGRIGFMTQDIEEIVGNRPFPILVKSDLGPAGLNYAGFVPIITNAIQELSARLRALEK